MPKEKIISGVKHEDEPLVQRQKIKNNLSMPRSRKIFIVLMLAYPILHFLVFWFYININTFVISFERFSFAEGKNVFVGFMNYELFFSNLFLLYVAIPIKIIFFILLLYVILQLIFVLIQEQCILILAR